MKKILNKLTIYNVSVTALILIIAWQIYGVTIYLPTYEKYNFIQKHINEPTIAISPTVAPTPTPLPKIESWSLKHNSQTVATFNENFTYEIKNWKNYLFFIDTKESKLRRLDTATNAITTIYEASKSGIKPEVTYDNTPAGFGYLDIIDNSLVFNINAQGNGFTRIGATYAMNLASEQTPRIMMDFPGYIEKISAHLMLTQTTGGDTCGGIRLMATFDPESATARKIATTHIGCSTGEEFIGISKNNRMILAYQDGKTGPGGPFYDGLSHYEYVLALPLDNPENKEGLIARSEMPANVNDIKYYPEFEKLLLVGNSVYQFDLSAQKLSKITDLPENWKNVWIDKQEGTHVCVIHPLHNRKDYEGEINYVEGRGINIVDGTIEQDNTFCPYNNTYTFDHITPTPVNLENVKGTLQLPAGYELVKNN